MIQRLRRLSGVAARPLAEDLARKIAHELRASSAALASVDQLGVGHLGTVQLAKYTLARALIQSQRAGCSLYPPRPAAQTPNGLSPADERLIRAVAALEEMSARRAPKAGASSASAPDAGAGKASPALLTAANKADRTFLMSFLADVLHSSAEPMDAAQLLARWRRESASALSSSTVVVAELKDLRAHLLSRLELDRQQRELDIRKRLQRARASEADAQG